MLSYFGFVFLALIIGQSSCTDEQPEEPKADYDVFVNRFLLGEDAKKYFSCEKNTAMKMTKVNKTHCKFNGECDLTQDLPPDGFVQILGYEREKSSNNYLEDPSFNITRPICEFMGNDKMIYPKLLLCSNFPVTCPVRAQHLKVDEFYLDMSNFPPNPPSNFWLITIKMHEFASCSAPVVSSADLYIELRPHKKKDKKKGDKENKEENKDENKDENKEENKEEKKDKGKNKDKGKGNKGQKDKGPKNDKAGQEKGGNPGKPGGPPGGGPGGAGAGPGKPGKGRGR